ncbi:MAG: 50S ribosomal protein L28 [Alphaproteobacteria bacterium]|nr:50S ribosomal protein L28 [Alphaproteobacteria bacterium]
MARRCMITGIGPMSGNNVSHAHNKTRRRFLPNLQMTSLLSDALGEMVRLRVTPKAIRTIEFKGGLDAFLLGTANRKLPIEARRLKRRIEKKLAKAA